MKCFFRVVRWFLQPVTHFRDGLLRQAWPERTPEEQQMIDKMTANLALYEFKACPYCVTTRRTMRRLGLNIELRDVLNDPQHKRELILEGGKDQVPCLRILNDDGSVEWMYESKDIQNYLEQRFGEAANMSFNLRESDLSG